MQAMRRKMWSPYLVGAGIGILSWFVFATAHKPLGITTAFENSAALSEKAVAPHVEQTNPFFEKKAREGKSPKIDWEWMLVLGVFLGAWVSSRLSGDKATGALPKLWEARFGPGKPLRYAAAFFGGALMMFGARMAQGCTSGHGISGALQFAVSSWIFVPILFLTGIAVAFLLYGVKGGNYVRAH